MTADSADHAIAGATGMPPGAAGGPSATAGGPPGAAGMPPGAAGVPAGAAGVPPATALTIDALGRKCPIPIIMLAERIREVPIGELISVLADDPAARTDLPAWCRLKSQEFVVETTLAHGWAFTVRRCY